MFPIDTNLLITISAPVALVSFLILVKIKQEAANRRRGFKSSSLKVIGEKGRSTPKIAQSMQISSKEGNQKKCLHYFGYLYNQARPHRFFRTNSKKTSFPDECYSCPKLVECLYSPTIVQSIYKYQDDKTEQNSEKDLHQYAYQRAVK